jgi:ankyrin repeat protein
MLKRLAIIVPAILVVCLTISYPFCRGRFYASKIIKAVQQNDVDAVKSLLNKGANINAKNRVGETLLIISIEHKCKEITNLLLQKGADVNIKQNTYTMTEDQLPSYLKQFISKPAKTIIVGGRSALHWAVFKDDMDLIDTLLAKGANIDAVDAQGETPLHHAVTDGQTEIIKLLLSRGANVNFKESKFGLTPLHLAVIIPFEYKTEIINLLLEYGTDIDAVTNKGVTPVQFALTANHPEIVKLLISEGANVNNQDIDGEILLHSASKRGNSDLVKILLSNGAKPNIKDNDGKTPLDIAIKEGHSEIVIILKEHGAKTGAELDESGQ